MAFKIYGLPKDTLNPKFWDNKDKLISSVRQQLLLIAEKFFETLELNTEIKDIRFLGSSADYTWNTKSDIDLHIIIDFSNAGCDKETIKTLVNAKKNLFNNEYKIKIFSTEVELYVEDINDENKADAIYSLLDNIWIKKPNKKELPNIRYNKIEQYVTAFTNAIEQLNLITNPYTKMKKAVELRNRLKQIRQTGLASSKKNFSEENLAFKTLRATNKIKKLRDEMVDAMEQILSLNKKEK